MATLVFLALYVVRTRQEAGRRGRGRWGAESSLLSGPRDYELRIDVPLSPVRGQDLDDVATMLGRRVAINERGRQLDVDRTLDRTLSAGLAPQLALRAPRAATSIVVLEDASESMRRYRFIVRYVLNGLEARGVVLDQWRFDTDGSRVWRASDRVSISLKQLLRLRGENAILILSDGLGVLDGATLRVAPWVHMLRGWRSRAWVHPLSDRVYWHPGLGRVPCEVRPMTASGLLAAARVGLARFGHGPGLGFGCSHAFALAVGWPA